MATVRQFEDLEVWQKARELNRMIYAVSSAGAFARDFPLRGQARDASISVMANIAEGFERGGNKEFVQFLAVAKGSCGELRSHLCVAFDQRYLTHEQCHLLGERALEVSRMVSGLMKHLRQTQMRGRKYQ